MADQPGAQPVDAEPGAVAGVVVGRIYMEQISVKTDHGTTISVRVHPEIGAELNLGRRVGIVLGQSGRPESIRPLPNGPSDHGRK